MSTPRTARPRSLVVLIGGAALLAGCFGPGWEHGGGSTTTTTTAEPTVIDTDNDGVANAEDNCPFVVNPSQENADQDNAGDACDNAPQDGNVSPPDDDSDGRPNHLDSCPDDQMHVGDSDQDGIDDVCDPSVEI